MNALAKLAATAGVVLGAFAALGASAASQPEISIRVIAPERVQVVSDGEGVSVVSAAGIYRDGRHPGVEVRTPAVLILRSDAATRVTLRALATGREIEAEIRQDGVPGGMIRVAGPMVALRRADGRDGAVVEAARIERGGRPR